MSPLMIIRSLSNQKLIDALQRIGRLIDASQGDKRRRAQEVYVYLITEADRRLNMVERRVDHATRQFYNSETKIINKAS